MYFHSHLIPRFADRTKIKPQFKCCFQVQLRRVTNQMHSKSTDMTAFLTDLESESQISESVELEDLEEKEE